MSVAVGMRLGPYEILSALGAGRMGEVYSARHPPGPLVTITILPDHRRSRLDDEEAPSTSFSKT